MASLFLFLMAPVGEATEISTGLPAYASIYRELRWADDLGLLAGPLPGHRPLSRQAAFQLLQPTRGQGADSAAVSSGIRRRIQSAGTNLVPWELYWDKGLYPITVGGNLFETLSLSGSSLTGGGVAPEPWNQGELYEDGLRLQDEGSLFLEGDWLALHFGYRLTVSDYEQLSLRPLILTARSGWRNLRLTLGREPLWWSPSDRSALLLSNNARPLDQLRLESDSPWRTAVGRWHLAGFVARLDDPDRGDFPNPWLTGMRVAWEPAKWFVLGATRMVMLGGEGNPYVLTWGSLWDLLAGRNENRKDPEDSRNDTDQLGSVEASLYLWPLLRQVPLLEGGRLYVERGGEDSPQGKHFNSVLPSAPGLTLGLELVTLGAVWRGEATTNVDDANVWYWHRRYRDGYRYRDRILGHAMGGDAHAYALEVEIPLAHGRDVATLHWEQWDRGHEALLGAPRPTGNPPIPRGIQDFFVARYEYGLGRYPGYVGVEGRYRHIRGDEALFGNQETWGVTISYRR